MIPPPEKCPNCQSEKLSGNEKSLICTECKFDLTELYMYRSIAADMVSEACKKRNNGNLVESALLLKEAIDFDSTRPEYHLLLGIVYQQLDLRERATRIFNTLINDPKYKEIIPLLL